MNFIFSTIFNVFKKILFTNIDNDPDEIKFLEDIKILKKDMEEIINFEEEVFFDEEINELMSLMDSENLTLFKKDDLTNWQTETDIRADQLAEEIFNENIAKKFDEQLLKIIDIQKIIEQSQEFVDDIWKTDCLFYNVNLLKLIECYDKLKEINCFKELKQNDILDLKEKNLIFKEVLEITKRSVLNRTIAPNEALNMDSKNEAIQLFKKLDKIKNWGKIIKED